MRVPWPVPQGLVLLVQPLARADPRVALGLQLADAGLERGELAVVLLDGHRPAPAEERGERRGERHGDSHHSSYSSALSRTSGRSAVGLSPVSSSLTFLPLSLN